MKKVLLFILLCFGFISTSFADLNTETDYTLIDCINGDDVTALAFDKDKPYQTLKGGIESTIEFINENINIPGNEASASGMIFNIKVECSANNLLIDNINLNFYGEKYNNELVLEGINENSFVIENIYFDIPNNSGRIIFKNVELLDNSKYGYFLKTESTNVDYSISSWKNRFDIYNFYGIKFLDSYINLKPNTYLASNNKYTVKHSVKYWPRNLLYRVDHSFYLNQVFIYNSIFNIDVDSDYKYKNIFLLKDSKLNFKTISGTGVYNINFIEESNHSNINNYGNSILLSNEIDLGGNNFKSQNSSLIAYINNKFTNFNDFDFGGDSIYFNNTIENKNEIDISNSKYLINNIFNELFIDNYDLKNLRKNYQLSEIGNKGIGWIFNIKSNINYFNTHITSAGLYKEITGISLPENKESIYVIYNK